VETPNRKSAGLLALIAEYDPDVVLTLETDSWWEKRLSTVSSQYPHRVECPLDNLYGMHLFSKFPLRDTEIQFLIEPDVPSIHTIIEIDDKVSVRAHFLHPAPPSPTENEESLERDAESLIVGRSVATFKEPVLIAGDLNDVAWSRTSTLFKRISGLRDPRIGRGLINTFHAKLPFVRFPLDHIFLSEHFSVRSLKRLSSINSDHFPIYAELLVSTAPMDDIALPQAAIADHHEASETIAEAGGSVSDVHQPRP